MATNSIAASLRTLIDRSADHERDRVVLWLAENGLAVMQHTMDWPIWRLFLWAMIHPIRFGKAAAISQAIIGLRRGDHRSEKGEG